MSDLFARFPRSDSLRRHLAKGICKQEDEEEQQDETEEESDDNETEDEIPIPESTMSKTEPSDRIMKLTHDALQKDFDDAVEN